MYISVPPLCDFNRDARVHQNTLQLDLNRQKSNGRPKIGHPHHAVFCTNRKWQITSVDFVH